MCGEGSGMPPTATLAWSPGGDDAAARSLLKVDRVALRRMLLALLALRPEAAAGK